MYALDKTTRDARISDVLTQVGLIKRADDLVRTFSRGMQQRLAIARAISTHPSSSSMSHIRGWIRTRRRLLDGVLREVVSQGRTVIMTTHDLLRGVQMADRVAILSKGVIAYDARRDELDPLGFATTYAEITGMAGLR